MKANRQQWIDATANLNERRKKIGVKTANSIVADYGMHLKKCGYGKSVLDVGCGTQQLRDFLPDDVKYIGLDAFPIANTNTFDMAIEEVNWKDKSVDTVCAFAVLDNCLDFDKACENMKRLAKKNIIIITGINIPVDKYHTFNLQHSDFDRMFSDWNRTYFEQLTPHVYLICYEPQ